jgi:hypothetical protein
MPAISARKRRGTAQPRSGWSGVAPLTTAQLSASDIDLEALLPGHHSPIEQIVLELRDLGGRYHRYLHQDELGPTRAERMAALRSLLKQLDLLSSRLYGLPGYLRLRLSKQLASRCGSVEDIDKFEAHRNDDEAVRQVGEAATDEVSMMHATSMTSDAALMDDIRGAAENAGQLLSVLDTTTAGAVVLDTELPPLEIAQNDEDDLIGLAMVCARIERLRCRVEKTLANLERRKGAERSESLRWLVWELCELYKRETGKSVTNSAVSKDKFTSEPQSPAGRFVLAAAAALRPSEAWMREHSIWNRGMRARVLNKGGLKRAVYFAMRQYVAHHSLSSDPRGRSKRRPVIL